MLTILAVVLRLGTETWLLSSAGHDLEAALQRQQEALDQSRQVRAQLESITVGIRRLARRGNDNARRLLAQFEEQGLRIEP